MPDYDLIIIGGGSAGLAAAIEADNLGSGRILLIERDKELGGILQQCIHNGFGLHEFHEELSGPEYAERFIQLLAERPNIEYKLNTMVLDLTADHSVRILSPQEGIRNLQARAVILAMGCRERTRGAIAIPGDRPAGIFTAGSAQRFINMEGYMVGKTAVLLGSGDIGLIMARRMTLEGAEVKAVVELQAYSGGLRRNIVQCLDDYGIPLLLSHTVTKIHGKSRLEGVSIAAVDESGQPQLETEQRIDCDTLLLSVGLIPENELSKAAGIELDQRTNGPLVNENLETSCSGIFACGNVLHVHDLVDFVSEEGRKAARSACAYLQGRAASTQQSYPIIAGAGVSYTVPQYVAELPRKDALLVYFRVRQIFNRVRIGVYSGDKCLLQLKKRHLAPGEMEHIKIPKEKLQELSAAGIELRIEEEAEHA